MKYPIQPEHIDAGVHMYDAFDNTETEISAGRLVRFAQDRGKSWESFTLKSLQAYYNKKYGEKFRFNRLIDSESVIVNLSEAFAHVAEIVGNAQNRQEALTESLLNPYQGEFKNLGGGWIIVDEKGNHYFTHDFIARCFKASPSLTKEI